MPIAKYDTITTVAELTGVARSTLRSAVDRGEIETQQLASGTVVISIDDVERWKNQDRQPGRPRKGKD